MVTLINLLRRVIEMILNSVNKSQVDNLYNENLLVNLGDLGNAISQKVFSDGQQFPYGVYSEYSFKRNGGYIYPEFISSKPLAYINLEYSKTSNIDTFDKVLQVKMTVDDNERVLTFDQDTSINITSKVRVHVVFDKIYTDNSSSTTESKGKIGIMFTGTKGETVFPTIKITGLKLEKGTIPTAFPEADSTSQILEYSRAFTNWAINGNSDVIPAPESSIGTFTKWSAHKLGKIVVLNGEFKFSQAGSGWNNTGTLIALKPVIHVAGCGFNNSSASRTPQGFYLTTAGVLNIIGTFNANDIIDFSFTYVTS